MAGIVLLTHALLIDGTGREPREGATVVVEGSVIKDVAPSGRVGALGGEVTTLDLRGRTLMPGLIDAHVHAAITTMNLAAMTQAPPTLVAFQAGRVLEGMLRRGFTTVRDAGGADFGLAEAVARGLVAGPRIFYSGRVLSQTGGHGDFRSRAEDPARCACQIHTTGFAHVADGADAVRKAAREELRRGAHQVKIMASGGVASPSDPIWNLQYSEGEMRAIVEEAAGWRTYAMAHAYTPEAIRRAVNAGVRSVEHGNLIDPPTAARMREAGAFLVPTLVTYFAIDELGRKLGFPAVSQAKVKDVLDAGLASLEIAREADVPIGFGTDLLGETHDQQSREFAIRARALPPLEIVRSATVVNAELLGRRGELGVVAPGALADLLVVEGDPLADVAPLADPERHLALVVKGGVPVVDRL
jgi:imidazolonepropionase-like amidohydrolase